MSQKTKTFLIFLVNSELRLFFVPENEEDFDCLWFFWVNWVTQNLPVWLGLIQTEFVFHQTSPPFLRLRRTEERSSGVPTTWWGKPRSMTCLWTPPASTPPSAVRTAASGECGGVSLRAVRAGAPNDSLGFSSAGSSTSAAANRRRSIKDPWVKTGFCWRYGVTPPPQRPDPLWSAASCFLSGSGRSVGSVRGHQLLRQKHQHLRFLQRRVRGHGVRTLG